MDKQRKVAVISDAALDMTSRDVQRLLGEGYVVVIKDTAAAATADTRGAPTPEEPELRAVMA